MSVAPASDWSCHYSGIQVLCANHVSNFLYVRIFDSVHIRFCQLMSRGLDARKIISYLVPRVIPLILFPISCWSLLILISRFKVALPTIAFPELKFISVLIGFCVVIPHSRSRFNLYFFFVLSDFLCFWF